MAEDERFLDVDHPDAGVRAGKAPIVKSISVDFEEKYEDVLILLKKEFGRDVVFDYEYGGAVIR
ncbi:hypothetical protein T484DRAFT_1870171, partial [Baffinella frigidus]